MIKLIAYCATRILFLTGLLMFLVMIGLPI